MRRNITAILVSLLRSGILVGANRVLLDSGGFIPGLTGFTFPFWSIPLYIYAGALFLSDVARGVGRGYWGFVASLAFARTGLAILTFGGFAGLEPLSHELSGLPWISERGIHLESYLGHTARLAPWAVAWLLAITLYQAAKPRIAALLSPTDDAQGLYVAQDLARVLFLSGVVSGIVFLLLHPSGFLHTGTKVNMSYLQLPLYVFAFARVISHGVAIFGLKPWRYGVAIALHGGATAFLVFTLFSSIPRLLDTWAQSPAWAGLAKNSAPYMKHLALLRPWVTMYIIVVIVYSLGALYIVRPRFPLAYQRLLGSASAPLKPISRAATFLALIFLFFHKGGFIHQATELNLSVLELPLYIGSILFLASSLLTMASWSAWAISLASMLRYNSVAVMVYGFLINLPVYAVGLKSKIAIPEVIDALMPYAAHISVLGYWALTLIPVIGVYQGLKIYITKYMEESVRRVPASPTKTLLINTSLGSLVFLLLHPQGFIVTGLGIDLTLFQIPLYLFLTLRLVGDLVGYFGKGLWRYAVHTGLRGVSWIMLAYVLLHYSPELANRLARYPGWEGFGRSLAPYMTLVSPLAPWVSFLLTLATSFAVAMIYLNRPQYPWIYGKLDGRERELVRKVAWSAVLALSSHLLFSPSGLLKYWLGVQAPFIATALYFFIALYLASQLMKMFGTGRWRYGLLAVLLNSQLAKALSAELNAIDHEERQEFQAEISAIDALLKNPSNVEEAERQLALLKENIAKGGAKQRRMQRLYQEALAILDQVKEQVQQERFDDAERNLDKALSHLEMVSELSSNTDSVQQGLIEASMQALFEMRAQCWLGRAASLLKEAREYRQQGHLQKALMAAEGGIAQCQRVQELAAKHGLHQQGQAASALIAEARSEVARWQQEGTLAESVQSLYEFQELLGRGGQAEVWRARRIANGLLVALKIPIGARGQVITLGFDAYQAFAQEIRHWQNLHHPHIVQMYESGNIPYPWISMELMEGGSLRSRLRLAAGPSLSEQTPEGGLRLKDALLIAISIIDALAYAHDGGVYHRDIKPENILFTKDGIPKLSDWGIAVHFHTFYGGKGFQGTLPYSAPELLAGAKADRRTDLFSFGIVLYEMLTGRYPFTQEGSLPTDFG
ncbi:MAG: protein kinase, partial [Candidatus Caldarchaeum sp.]